jgi:amino acid transporter
VLGRKGFPAGIPTYAAFYDIAALAGGSWLKATLSIAGVFLANVGAGLTAQAAVSRLFFSMARDGRLPRALSRVHPRRGVPDRATLLVAVITLGLIIFFATRLELLVTIVSFGALTAFLFVHASVVKHFLWDRRSRNWLRHLLAPGIGFGVVAVVIWGMSGNAKIVGGCWMAVGLAIAMLQHMGRPARVAP